MSQKLSELITCGNDIINIRKTLTIRVVKFYCIFHRKVLSKTNGIAYCRQ